MGRARLASVVVGLAVTFACGGGGGDEPTAAVRTTAPAPTTTSAAPTTTTPAATTTNMAAAPTTTSVPARGTTPPAGPPRVRAVKVADLDAPLALAVRSGDDALYVAGKGGRVVALRDGTPAAAPTLDLTGQVSTGSEQGLLGLAFSPDGARLYANFTDPAGDTRVVEYAFGNGRADPASRRVVLAVDQPFANHNGGNLAFGRDGMLYIGLGDGGSGGDPMDNGQRLDTLLGKILRIDPRPGDGRPYTIPSDNPFTARQGARPEIWAYGLRNPWRFSFDRETGALWIGDVGQGSREEVDAASPDSKGGENYGWNRFEGTRPFAGRPPADTVAPVHDYPRANGNCAVTGGYVYRGRRIAGLRGSYVFADYCRGEIRALTPDGGRLRSVDLGAKLPSVASFGEDGDGELYVLSLTAGVFRLEPA